MIRPDPSGLTPRIPDRPDPLVRDAACRLSDDSD